MTLMSQEGSLKIRTRQAGQEFAAELRSREAARNASNALFPKPTDNKYWTAVEGHP
jgi:hypothetical protein